MRNKKFILILGIFLAIGIVVIFISSFLFSKTNKEILRFEEEFGLKLPEETLVIFSEDDHGALGDGTRLYIYQLSSKCMAEFNQQEGLMHWWRLPFDGKLSLGLMEKIRGVSSKNIADNMVFGSCKGYYLVKNRYNKPLKGYNFNDISYSNIIIAIVDLESNKIYYFTLDM